MSTRQLSWPLEWPLNWLTLFSCPVALHFSLQLESAKPTLDCRVSCEFRVGIRLSNVDFGFWVLERNGIWKLDAFRRVAAAVAATVAVTTIQNQVATVCVCELNWPRGNLSLNERNNNKNNDNNEPTQWTCKSFKQRKLKLNPIRVLFFPFSVGPR